MRNLPDLLFTSACGPFRQLLSPVAIICQLTHFYGYGDAHLPIYLLTWNSLCQEFTNHLVPNVLRNLRVLCVEEDEEQITGSSFFVATYLNVVGLTACCQWSVRILGA